VSTATPATVAEFTGKAITNPGKSFGSKIPYGIPVRLAIGPARGAGPAWSPVARRVADQACSGSQSVRARCASCARERIPSFA
jgi:hypothetical protein